MGGDVGSHEVLLCTFVSITNTSESPAFSASLLHCSRDETFMRRDFAVPGLARRSGARRLGGIADVSAAPHFRHAFWGSTDACRRKNKLRCRTTNAVHKMFSARVP